MPRREMIYMSSQAADFIFVSNAGSICQKITLDTILIESSVISHNDRFHATRIVCHSDYKYSFHIYHFHIPFRLDSITALCDSQMHLAISNLRRFYRLAALTYDGTINQTFVIGTMVCSSCFILGGFGSALTDIARRGRFFDMREPVETVSQESVPAIGQFRYTIRLRNGNQPIRFLR